jgi:hypothetical protein
MEELIYNITSYENSCFPCVMKPLKYFFLTVTLTQINKYSLKNSIKCIWNGKCKYSYTKIFSLVHYFVMYDYYLIKISIKLNVAGILLLI